MLDAGYCNFTLSASQRPNQVTIMLVQIENAHIHLCRLKAKLLMN